MRAGDIIKIFKVFGDIIRQHFFHSIKFMIGSGISAFVQVVSLGSLYPIILVVIGKEDKADSLVLCLNKVLTFLSLQPSLANYLFLFVGMAGVSAVISVVVDWEQNRFLRQLEHELRMDVMKKILQARWVSLRDLNHGEFASVMVQHADRYKVMIKYMFLSVATLIQIVFLIGYLFTIDVRFTFLSFGLMISGFLLVAPIVRLSHKWGHVNAAAIDHQMHSLMGVARSFKNIKASSLEDYLLRYLSPIFYKVSNIYCRLMILSTVQNKISELIGFMILGLLLFLSIGIFHLPVSRLLLALVVLTRAIPFARSVVTYVHDVYTNLPSLEKIQEIVRQCVKEKGRDKKIQEPIKIIQFDAVTFCYGNHVNLFSGLSAIFQRGEFWAISGATGSGKTTILDLISGVLDPVEGRILVDGKDCEDINRVSLHQHVGYLTQNSFIFAGTIFENICWGWEHSDRYRLERAVQISQLGDFVKEKSLDYRVSESGQNLSGGQQQRIAIARLLAGEYDFILMDEPTSALDYETEKRFLVALSRFKGKIGIIMVTHRKEYLQYADHVLVFDGSRVIIDGMEKRVSE